MNLIGEKVISTSYGTGTITSAEGNYMTVQFPEKSSKFKYPDAFQKQISLENDSLQAEMSAIAMAAVNEKELAQEKKKAEMFREVMRSIEESRAPVKREPSSKTTTPHKEALQSEQKETIKWDPGKRRTYYVF